MGEQSEALVQLFSDLGKLLAPLWHFVVGWLLLIVWIAWWLWGVDWKKVWSVLAQGAWLPVILLMVVGALAWSQMAPSDLPCLGLVTVPNFWWQLGGVGVLVALTLLCGWLQGVLGWTPPEVNLEPPAASAHAHGNGHH